MTYDAGNGEQTDYTPIWTLQIDLQLGGRLSRRARRSRSSTATRPASAGRWRRRSSCRRPMRRDEDRPAEYKAKYCTDDGLIKTLKAIAQGPRATSTARRIRRAGFPTSGRRARTGAGRSAISTSPSTRAIPRTSFHSAGTARSARPGRRRSR